MASSPVPSQVMLEGSPVGSAIVNRDEAEAHWEYTEQIILKMLDLVHLTYVEAMIHGAKHEREVVEGE